MAAGPTALARAGGLGALLPGVVAVRGRWLVAPLQSSSSSALLSNWPSSSQNFRASSAIFSPREFIKLEEHRGDHRRRLRDVRQPRTGEESGGREHLAEALLESGKI